MCLTISVSDHLSGVCTEVLMVSPLRSRGRSELIEFPKGRQAGLAWRNSVIDYSLGLTRNDCAHPCLICSMGSLLTLALVRGFLYRLLFLVVTGFRHFFER